MTAPRRPRNRHGFEIALFCALRTESDAVLSLFDGHWRDHGGEFSKLEGDNNVYWTGWVGSHNVVLVQLLGMGNTNAAGVAGSLLPSYPRIRLSLIVGICGGVPGRTEKEMILGDVIISTRIIQLHPASRYPDTLIVKDTYKDQLERPSREIMTFLEQIQGKQAVRRLQNETAKYTRELCELDSDNYLYPGADDDKLYESGYRHKHQDSTVCDICARCEKYEDSVCSAARTASCAQLRCDNSKLVIRRRLQNLVATRDENINTSSKRARMDVTATLPTPVIHFGPVGSGDWVIKSQMHRDSVNKEVIAYEMEGSGVSHYLPTLVIKSVCDYSDSHKNKDWQNYAAATAAACMKALLHAWPNTDNESGTDDSLPDNVATSHHSRLAPQIGHKPNTTQQPIPKLKTRKQKRKFYLDSLYFDQIDSRHEIIKIAHAKTCRWLFERTDFRNWLLAENQPQHHGRSFFWIKGNPGTGKSTMMKWLLVRVKEQVEGTNTIVLWFFFNARGEYLEKSTLGVYRSILFQLLNQLPELQDVLDSLPSLLEDSTDPRLFDWKLDKIQSLFEKAVKQIKGHSLICMIDALDECGEDEVRDMVVHLESLGGLEAAIRFRTCFSSRHYPYITVENSIQLFLEDQDEHRQDITEYLDSALKADNGNTTNEIKSEILKRASGIFLWVVLVVAILNKEYDHGRIYTMRKRLDEIPNGLEDLFYDILTRDTQHMGELTLCLQWVLFVRTPLRPIELYHGILVSTDPEAIREASSEAINQKAIQRFIVSASKGLAEVTRDGTIQFIHESVRDFFLLRDGLRRLWPDLVDNFQGLSHEQLRQCCENYITIVISRYPFLANPIQLTRGMVQGVSATFPLLKYVIHNAIYHADSAAESGIEQEVMVERFSTRNWVALCKLFDNDDSYSRHPYTHAVSRLYIFASENLGSLVRIERENVQTIDIQGEKYGTPLLSAIFSRNEKALRALLAPAARHQFVIRAAENQQFYLSDEKHESVIRHLMAMTKFNRTKHCSLLTSAIESGELNLVIALVNTGKVDLNAKDNYGSSPLSWAAVGGHEAIVRVLLETGQVNADNKDNYGRTPLLRAAAGGHEGTVKLLLETGQVNVDGKDGFDQTPLSQAVAGGHDTVVKLLIETNRVDVDTKDFSGRTPLTYAAMGGYETVVKLLLQTGQVDIDAKDSSDRTPLSWAAGCGHVAVVRLLLETGQVDVNSKDFSQRTPLSWAARAGNDAVVELFNTGPETRLAYEIGTL